MNTELPDKIYIREYKLNGKSMFGDWYGNNPPKETPHINNIEFIRKDALLEWAKEWHKRYPYSHEFEMIIDKINSL